MSVTKDGAWRPWEPGDPVRALPYGHFRVGKTFGAGTFPRPCILDYDRGLGTLYAPDFLRKHGVVKFQHKSFWETSYDGPIVANHNAYDDSCRYFDEMMKPGKRETFDTWVIDSGTTLGEFAQHKGVILLGTKEYGERSHSQKLARQFKMLVPVIQDYGAERSLVEQFVDMVLSTEKHVVLIAHEKEIRDKAGALIAIAPAFTGQSAETVPLRFDEVYQIRTRRGETKYDAAAHSVLTEWEHVCMTQTDGVYRVGSRNGVPDNTLWNYDAVLKALTANYEERKRLMAAQAEAERNGLASVASPPAAV